MLFGGRFEEPERQPEVGLKAQAPLINPPAAENPPAYVPQAQLKAGPYAEYDDFVEIVPLPPQQARRKPRRRVYRAIKRNYRRLREAHLGVVMPILLVIALWYGYGTFRRVVPAFVSAQSTTPAPRGNVARIYAVFTECMAQTMEQRGYVCILNRQSAPQITYTLTDNVTATWDVTYMSLLRDDGVPLFGDRSYCLDRAPRFEPFAGVRIECDSTTAEIHVLGRPKRVLAYAPSIVAPDTTSDPATSISNEPASPTNRARRIPPRPESLGPSQFRPGSPNKPNSQPATRAPHG